MRSKQIVSALLLIVMAGMVTGCTGTSGEGGTRPRPVPQLSIQPGDQATNVSPALPASVSVTEGVLQRVVLTSQAGKVIAGDFGPARHTWRSTRPLAFDETYTWSGTAAVGADQHLLPVTGSFTTVAPEREVEGTLNIDDGAVVGIAAPIILQFDHEVTDKAAVERALQVQASVPTEGSWAWLPDSDDGSRVHYRPRNYWLPGTRVSVVARLYGLHVGEGSYGTQDLNTHFTVGRAQIVKADVKSHRMVVVRDGREVMNFPASYGLASDPVRNTTNGIHVVMSKAETVLMSNPAYGYVNLPEHWAVRISNNGEFIHANPGTTGVQGSDNVTHGCVNLSTENAQEYFHTAVFGDPVEVTNSPRPMSSADGDIYDWTLPWESWKSMSSLTNP